MSFAHGSNDIANAIGPFATIYLIWKEGDFEGSKAPVPVWILAYGGAGLVLGLATYGYKIMAVLGNRITLHSPSRGFSMEFGAAITVAMATRLALPISTTQSIAGSTIAVGLCNGDYKAINWKMVLWICFGWVITLPVTGLFSGLIFAVMINSPRFGFKSTIATSG
jgi:sodium-dependent phosphate transporter